MSNGENIGCSVGERIATTGMGKGMGRPPKVTSISVASGGNELVAYFNYEIDTATNYIDGFFISVGGVFVGITQAFGSPNTIRFVTDHTFAGGDVVDLYYDGTTGGVFGVVTAAKMESMPAFQIIVDEVKITGIDAIEGSNDVFSNFEEAVWDGDLGYEAGNVFKVNSVVRTHTVTGGQGTNRLKNTLTGAPLVGGDIIDFEYTA